MELKISSDLTIAVNEDGTIEPVKNAEMLKEDILDSILIEMGFQYDDLFDMDVDMKIDIVKQGGRLKSVELEDVNYSSFDYENNQQYNFEGETFEDVKQEVEEKHQELEGNSINNDVSILGAGTTSNGWDKTDSSHNWKGQTYVLYLGKTANNFERKYNAYVKFRWDKKPAYANKDDFGIWWNTKAEKWASNNTNKVFITGSNGGAHDLLVTTDSSSIYGTKWNFNWISPYTIYACDGWGRQEIRVPTSYTGTVVLQGGYLHKHLGTSGSIVFGVLGLNFSTSGGDQWRWTESFSSND